MSAAALITVLQILSVLGSALTVIRLYRNGLYGRYRAFFWYFVFRIPNTIWPLFFSNFFETKALVYYYFWVATEPITWIFHTVVVLELYRLVLEKHKGLYTVGRWAMFVGMATSIILSLVSLIPRMSRALAEQSRTMFWYLYMERGVMLGLAIFLLFMMGFLVLYTVPISRNVRVHARIYSVFFFSNFLTFLLQSLFGLHVFSWTNAIAGAISTACVFAWLFLLSPKGEEVKTSHAIVSPDQERRILMQLDALNATLLKITQK